MTAMKNKITMINYCSADMLRSSFSDPLIKSEDKLSRGIQELLSL
jgi:hypothetical protein